MMDAELRERMALAIHVAHIRVDCGYGSDNPGTVRLNETECLEIADALAPIIAEVEAAARSASRDAATAEIVALRQSLLMAESWFRDYADQHNAKTPPDTVKAATNAERADYCHKAIDAAAIRATPTRHGGE
jgi:hypothetical protein